jgi:hypothetical protein
MVDQVKFQFSPLTVHQIVGLYKDGRLKLEPAFQRDGVWKPKQRVYLMRSIFQGYPIPSIFIYRHEEVKTGQTVFEVIDGKQRIETLLMYMGCKPHRFAAPVPLSGLENPRDLYWSQLRKLKKQSLLEDYKVQTIEVTGDLIDIIELFVRINSTGNALTPQEIRNARFYKSDFLKAAKKLATRFENYLLQTGVLGAQQILRMKHIELMSELIYSANLGRIGNKKRVLDAAMSKESGLKSARLRRATEVATTSLNRLRTMFPDLSRSVRFSKVSDFYSLAVVIQTFEAKGLILNDKKRNGLAWELLTAFALGVDNLSLASKKLEIQALSPRDELLRQYLFAVRSDSDSETSRQKRHSILEGLLQPLFEKKDQQRLFTPEQRRILWNTADERVCAECGCGLDWTDFHADHIKPYTLGGMTVLDNAAILCAAHNIAKGKKFREIA